MALCAVCGGCAGGENMTWRDHMRPIIAEIVGVFHPKDDERWIRKALRATYPTYYGVREYWPYKVWCDEVRRQLARRRGGGAIAGRVASRLPEPPDPRQGKLL